MQSAQQFARSFLDSDPFPHHYLRAQQVSNKISLITKGENSMSTVEQSEADSFIAKASEGAAVRVHS